MSEEHRLKNLFRERLPSHGFATDDLTYGLRFMAVQEAIHRAIIQYNWRHSIGWLAYDVDSETTRFDWDDNHCPPPNMLILNPENGHGHLLYGLKAPVHDYDGASQKALRYVAAIDIALTDVLGADPGFSKLLCKNPLHVRWETLYPRVDLYDLDELAGWLDLDKYADKRRRLPTVGYGRNCTLFETLRVWAYRARRQPFLTEELFYDRVLAHAMTINAEFNPPLPLSEVRSTAKSVSRWTWRKMSAAGFKARQKALSDKGNATKRKKALQLRQSILDTAGQCPELTQADLAAIHGVSQQTVSRHLKPLLIPHIR